MLRNGRVSAPGIAALATLSVLVTASFGCASRGGNVASSQPATSPDGQTSASLASSSANEPVTLTGVTLLSEGEIPKLLLTGAGPLAPTVYTRDEGRRIVVDLTNAVAAPGLEPPRGDGKLFSQVGMKSFVELGKPHVQLELNGKVALETRLGTEPGGSAMAVSFLHKGDPATLLAKAPEIGGESTPQFVPVDREPEPIKVETLPTSTASTSTASTSTASTALASKGTERVAETTTSAPVASASVASSSSASTSTSTPEIVARHAASSTKVASKLTSVTSKRKSDSIQVSLTGDGEFSYEAFVLQSPPRYVLDLTGVRNSSVKKVQEVADGPLTRVRVSQFKTDPAAVTRVVFDLTSGGLPVISQKQGGLVLEFADGATRVASMGASDQSVKSAEASKETKPTAVTNVSTPAAGSYEAHESEDPAPAASTATVATVSAPPASSAPVTVASAPSVPVKVEDPSPAPKSEPVAVQASVETAKVEAPKPVAAPAPAQPITPVVASKTVEAAPQLVTSTSPELPVSLPKVNTPVRRPKTSSDDRALVEAAEALLLQQDQAGKSKDLSNPYESKTIGGGDKVYTGEPITLNLKDADIKDTLQRFSELTGLNIVLDPNVNGTVTVSLTDIPWDQALELVLKINGLGYVLEGNVMRIAKTDKLQSEEVAKAKLLETQDLSRPVKTVIQKLSYAEAGGVRETVKNVMSARGAIYIDARSNTLIIKELPDYLPTVLDLIRTLDTATPQVVIEARIVEATRTFSKNLGISWGFDAVADARHGNTTGLVFPNNGNVTGQVSLANGANVLGFSLGNVLDTFKLDMTLSAAEARGLVKIISTPKVQTQTNQKASIQSGFQIPVQTTVNNTTTVLYIDATLRLDVTPQITSEGTVILDVKVQKREPAVALNVAGGSNVPLTTRDAATKLMVRDGGTAIIGGIFKLTTNDGQSMIPGLWKIPLLGNLFRNRTTSEVSDELMIFITPRIMKN